MKFTLRPYQKECLDTLIKGFSKKNKQLCVLPTGSGKTVVMCQLVEKLNLKTLIIAHTQELLSQIYSTLLKFYPANEVGIYHYKKATPRICVASFQCATYKSTESRLAEMDFDLMIIDECHRTASKGYRKIIDSLGFNKKKLLGFTATPFRTDGQSIYEIFGQPSYQMSIVEMINEKFLVDFVGYRVKTNVSLKGVRKQKGDFTATQLEPVINVKSRNDIIVNQFKRICPHDKTIAFCVSVRHAEDLKKTFCDNGISCEAIYGKMTKENRKRILERFRDGEIKVLTNCNLLTEGFDEPSVTALLMCRPTCSKGLYLQMIGRGSRLFPGKESCKVIEFTDNVFDACSIEDIIETKNHRILIRDGESITKFKERAKKELLDSDGSTEVEIINPLTATSYGQKLATAWQIQFLKSNNIKYQEPLLQLTADVLIKRYKNGIN